MTRLLISASSARIAGLGSVLLALLAFGLAVPVAWAAQQTAPPSTELRETRGATLVTAEAVEPGETAGSYRFAVRARHFGPSSHDSIELALDESTANSVNPGIRYLIGYSELARARITDKSQTRRVAPHLVRTVAAGEMIAAMSPELLRLLDGTLDKRHASQPSELAAAVIELLESTDPRTTRIAAGELLGRRGIGKLLQPGQLEGLAAFIGDVDRDPAARTTLVGFALAYREQFEDPWWAPAVSDVLTRTAVALPEGSSWPSLVVTSLRLATSTESELPAAALAERWLHCPHAGVVEAALAAISRSDPQRLENAVASALRAPFIDARARAALVQAQQRVSRRPATPENHAQDRKIAQRRTPDKDRQP